MSEMEIHQANGQSAPLAGEGRDVVLSVRDVTVAFGDNVVLDKLSLDVYRGEILGFVGASGTGKSVLLRTVLGLTPKRSGTVSIFGVDLDHLDDRERMVVDMRLGVLFQHGALFSALTVKENVQVPMREYLDLPKKLMDELAMLKIELVGLSPDAADKFPSELSGGMIKRAAFARAIVMDPKVLFCDEPSAGLDPVVASALDDLILDMRDAMGMSIVVVTHELDSAFKIADRITILDRGEILMVGTVEEVLASKSERVHALLNRIPEEDTMDPDEYLNRLVGEDNPGTAHL